MAERRDRTADQDEVARIMSQVAGREVGWVLLQAERGVPVLAWKAERRGGRYRLDLRTTSDGEVRLPGLRLLVDGKPVRADVTGVETAVPLKGVRARRAGSSSIRPAPGWCGSSVRSKRPAGLAA